MNAGAGVVVWLDAGCLSNVVAETDAVEDGGTNHDPPTIFGLFSCVSFDFADKCICLSRRVNIVSILRTRVCE